MDEKSLQERYSPNGICFGCGPTNKQGLRIRSFEQGDVVVCEWQPEPYHEAFPGMLNGGIIGTLMDCHCNWAALWHLMQRNQTEEAPSTVTAEYSIKLKRPTPTDKAVKIIARVVESSEVRATVEAELIAHDRVCATCRGIFVAVKPGHPAYQCW